jgi:hypothetical protein
MSETFGAAAGGGGRRRMRGKSTTSFAEAAREAMRGHAGKKGHGRFRVVSMEIEGRFRSPGEVDVYLIELEEIEEELPPTE